MAGEKKTAGKQTEFKLFLNQLCKCFVIRELHLTQNTDCIKWATLNAKILQLWFVYKRSLLLQSNAGKEEQDDMKNVVNMSSLRCRSRPWSPFCSQLERREGSSPSSNQCCQHSQNPTGSHNHLVFGRHFLLASPMINLDPNCVWNHRPISGAGSIWKSDCSSTTAHPDNNSLISCQSALKCRLMRLAVCHLCGSTK